MHWTAELLEADYRVKDAHEGIRHNTIKPLLEKAAQAAGMEVKEWAWNELLRGGHYGEPRICINLWETLARLDVIDMKTFWAWRDAEPHSVGRIQLAYCVHSFYFEPVMLLSMWLATSHPRDKNLLLCSLLQRVARNVEARRSGGDADNDIDYNDLLKLLDWFSQEEIVGGDQEEWGNSGETYAKLITRNQEQGTRLLQRAEGIENGDKDGQSEPKNRPTQN